MKKIIHFLHLWLGLVAGLLIFVIAITGAIYAFQPELSRLTQPYTRVSGSGERVAVSVLLDSARAALPGKRATRITVRGQNDAVYVMFRGTKPEPYYYNVYFDPYTGKILRVKNMDRDFFYQVLRGHMYLWLPEKVGKQITRWVTLVFFCMIISGIVLWWPKNRARRKSSFKLRFNVSFKRLNYDLHNVLGFYASWLILFTVLTALVWGFESVADFEKSLLRGERKKEKVAKFVVAPPAGKRYAIDSMIGFIGTKYPAAERYTLNFAANDSAVVTSRVYEKDGLFYNSDNLSFHPYTGAVVKSDIYAVANAAEKAARMNYDIHVGAIAGVTGRVLVFLAALVVASLPVTGFMIWWGRRKKKPIGQTFLSL